MGPATRLAGVLLSRVRKLTCKPSGSDSHEPSVSKIEVIRAGCCRFVRRIGGVRGFGAPPRPSPSYPDSASHGTGILASDTPAPRSAPRTDQAARGLGAERDRLAGSSKPGGV